MRAWLIEKVGPIEEQSQPLQNREVADPEASSNELIIRVSVCGICHTELDEIEGRTPPPRFPMIPGHQVVGRVEVIGKSVTRYQTGDRVGVGWIFSACGTCDACLAGNENLCSRFRATGRDHFGGYAELMSVPEKYAFPVPEIFKDEEAAPLLCAGAIGYRSLRLTGLTDGQRLGLTGFGASGHLVLMLSRFQFPHSDVCVFARSERERELAMELGAVWVGDTTDRPPELCDAIIDTTPVWKPVVEALRCLAPGGRLVINAIRKETSDQDDLLRLNYSDHLWMEKEIKSVANVARRDIAEFLEIAGKIPLRPKVQIYPFEDANKALVDLKAGRIHGAKVLKILS